MKKTRPYIHARPDGHIRGIVLFILVLICVSAGAAKMFFVRETRPIKVGVLHSLTGTMAISEKAVVDATLLAIEEINAAGGLLGRPVHPVIADGKSDSAVFSSEAERLITREKVSVVFGCWTSASRRTVVPVFEKHDHLLFYPVQYEGMESSPNVVYTGATPNQQIVPAVKWAFDNIGKRFFLVASDYVFPRVANEVIRDQIAALGGEIVGEEYIPLGSTDVQDAVSQIAEQKPDVILNTINGDTNVAFLRQLREAGVAPETTPVISFSISENELAQLDLRSVVGDYAAWNYFQSIDTPVNKTFIANFKKKYGADRTINDPMEAAYMGVYLWAQAVKEADTDEVRTARGFIANQSLLAPEGIVYVDPANQHTWKSVRIGKINKYGQFDIVWSSGTLVRPRPYPGSRPPYEWDDLLEGLFAFWNGNWANPSNTAGQGDKRTESSPENSLLQILSRDGVLVSSIEHANQAGRELDPDEIERLDRRWQDAGEESLFIEGILSGEASEVLRRFRKEHPWFKEIFVTDARGLNVAVTNKTTDYYQADEKWWQEAYRSEAGRVFADDIVYDRSAGAWAVPFFVPIAGQQGEVIGVMKALMLPDAQ